MSGVLAVGELPTTGITGNTLEIWGLGREVAEKLGGPVTAVLLGSGIDRVKSEALSYPLDLIYVADKPALASYDPDVSAGVIVEVCGMCDPELILLEHRLTGHDLAPRLANRLGTVAVTDSVGVEAGFQDGEVRVDKPVYGGVAIGRFAVDPRPVVVTVRVRIGTQPDRHDTAVAELEDISDLVDESSSRCEVLDRSKTGVEELGVEDAPVVIAGGRGMGGVEGFGLLRELAEALGGAVGASRPPCDSGWVPSTLQVGMTGKIVAPELYVAVAISGASQHLTGMRESGKIVAINKDPEAGIFDISHYGVVGDYREILPSLIEKIRELSAD